jgi:hypothetical protein
MRRLTIVPTLPEPGECRTKPEISIARKFLRKKIRAEYFENFDPSKVRQGWDVRRTPRQTL